MDTLDKFKKSIAAKCGESGKYAECVGTGAPVYMDVVSEYLSAKVLQLATKNDKELSCAVFWWGETLGFFGGGIIVEEQESKCSPSRIR
ncbi:hypothetical protein SUGI_0351050 [Cryptomeria japonica]|nr:hypothetical protein SUGI_0351050 [Cryptomeria japonica]